MYFMNKDISRRLLAQNMPLQVDNNWRSIIEWQAGQFVRRLSDDRLVIDSNSRLVDQSQTNSRLVVDGNSSLSEVFRSQRFLFCLLLHSPPNQEQHQDNNCSQICSIFQGLIKELCLDGSKLHKQIERYPPPPLLRGLGPQADKRLGLWL